MDATSRRCHVVLRRLTNEEIAEHTRRKTNSSKSPKSNPKRENKTYKCSTPKRLRPKKIMPCRTSRNYVKDSAHSIKHQNSESVMHSYVNKNKTAEDVTYISKLQNSKMATSYYANKSKTIADFTHFSKLQDSEMMILNKVNKSENEKDFTHISKLQNSEMAIRNHASKSETAAYFTDISKLQDSEMMILNNVNKSETDKDFTHISKLQDSEMMILNNVNKSETEDFTHISKLQNSEMAIQNPVSKSETVAYFTDISKLWDSEMETKNNMNENETCEYSSKQKNSGIAISRSAIDETTGDNVLIVSKPILKRRLSDSCIVEKHQNSAKQANNFCNNQRTPKKQRMKYDIVKTDKNEDKNTTVQTRKRKNDSELQIQNAVKSIGNDQCFENLPKKRRQEMSESENTDKSITNAKVTTASKITENQNSNFNTQLLCNQSTAATENKHAEKETPDEEKANVTVFDNGEILQNKKVENCSEMQKNQSLHASLQSQFKDAETSSASLKNAEEDDEDLVVLYDNFYTENRNHELSATYLYDINNGSKTKSHDNTENSRKHLNSLPVYNVNKMYFKTFTAAYENSLKKSTLFQVKNFYRMMHISELDLSNSFGYHNQFSNQLTNKISSIRLPIDTSEYRFDTACDLNENFLFNLIAAEDFDRLILDNPHNMECVIYYSCKINKRLSSIPRTITNFAGRIILPGGTKHLIKYPADLKKIYSLSTNKRDYLLGEKISTDKDVGDTIRQNNEADVYFTLHKMVQCISKKYDKEKHWHTCKCCFSPFSTYNELEPICRACNIYCTLDFHLKGCDSKDFPPSNLTRSLKKQLSIDFNVKNISDITNRSTDGDELIHKTTVKPETFENASIKNAIHNACLQLINGTNVNDGQEFENNEGGGGDVNSSTEIIVLDTDEAHGEHDTYLLLALENDGMPELVPEDSQSADHLESEIADEKDECEKQADDVPQVQNNALEKDGMPELMPEDLQVAEHLESEIADEKDECEKEAVAVLQVQNNGDSNFDFILLDDSNSGEILSTVEISVADDKQNLSNNSVLSCTPQSIGTTPISRPGSPEILIIDDISVKSSSDRANLPLTTSDGAKDLSKHSVIPTSISNPNSPDIEIIENTPIKLSSDTDNPELHSTTIDESEENVSKNSKIPTSISQAENTEIQIIRDTSIKSSSDTDNPKLHSPAIGEPEENSSKESPLPTCISRNEIEIIEDTSVCMSSNDASNPKLPSDTIDGTEKNVSENSVKPRSDSSEIRIIEATSISQSMFTPKLLPATTDISDNLPENSQVPTASSRSFALKIQIIEYDSLCNSSETQHSKLPTTDESVLEIPIVIDSIKMPSNMEENIVEHLSEDSLQPISTSQSAGPKIQILNYNSICESSSDIQDLKLPTIDESVLKTPVIIYSGEMPFNLEDTFVNEKYLSEDSPEPIYNPQPVNDSIQILEYKSLCQSDPNIFSKVAEESEKNSPENSQMTARISQSVAPKIQIQDPKLQTTDELVLKTPVIVYSSEMPFNVEDNFVNDEEPLSEYAQEPISNSQSVCPKIHVLEWDSLTDPKTFSNTTEESEENLSENSQMLTKISQPVSPKIKIVESISICENSSGTSKSLSTTIDESKDNFSENFQMLRISQPVSPKFKIIKCISVCENSCEISKSLSTTTKESEENLYENTQMLTNISQPASPKVPSLECNSVLRSSSDIHYPKSPSPTASTEDSNLNISVIQSGKGHTDTINSTNILLWNPDIPDKIVFSGTLPSSSVTEASINYSIEEVTLEEVVQRKTAENSNSVLKRDSCDSSDAKDDSESNFISNRDNHMDDCNSENSLQLSVEGKSIEHNAKKNDNFIHTLTIENVNHSSINSGEEVFLEENAENKNPENSNSALERDSSDFNDDKDDSESNFISDRDNHKNDCNSENSLQLSMEGKPIEDDAKKNDNFTHTLTIENVNNSSINYEKEVFLEENHLNDYRESHLNDYNSENSLPASIDIKESTKVIPESNSLSHEFLNMQKAKKDHYDYTRRLQNTSVNDCSISSSKDLSDEEDLQRQTAEKANNVLERGFCDVSDPKNPNESNFTSDKDSNMNDCDFENSVQMNMDVENSTEHDVPKANSVSNELLNCSISKNIPLKKRKIDYDVIDSSISSTEELPLEENIQRKNSNYTPERNFCNLSDVKNRNESNSKQNTDKYKEASGNFVYDEEDFRANFFKYMRVLEDLLPQEITSVKRSNVDGSENTYHEIEMLGIASAIASLDILNDYAKVPKFIDFVSKCLYYKENHENTDESEILKIKCFLKKLYVINDFIEKYGTYDKLVEDILKNGGKISVWDSNRDATKEGNLVRYSNTDPKLSKMKYLCETNDDSSTKGTTSNICDTYSEVLNNPALLADVNQQASSKYKNPYDKCCALTNCEVCSIHSDRNEDKLETIVVTSESYDESNARMSSKPENSNSHESGTLLNNKGQKLEKCIKKIKNGNELGNSNIALDSEMRTSILPSETVTYNSISPIHGEQFSTVSRTESTFSENLIGADSLQLKNNSIKKIKNMDELGNISLDSEIRASILPSETVTCNSISPIHGEQLSTVSRTESTFSENPIGAESSQLNNTSCLLDFSRVVDALTTDNSSEISQHRFTPRTLMNQVLKEKRPYRKRSDKPVKEKRPYTKRPYTKRNAKPTQEQLPVLTPSVSSLSQTIDTPVISFNTNENALANTSIPLSNQNASLYASQKQQPASANPSVMLRNRNPSLYMDQGQQYPLANPTIPIHNQSVIYMDKDKSLNASQTSGNMHYNYKTNPYFDYRMSSYSSPSKVPSHTSLTQSSSIQGVSHITGASSDSDALVRENIRQTDSSSLSRCSVRTSVTARTDINFEIPYTSALRHIANFASESRTSNTSRGGLSNYETDIQNTRTFTNSSAVPYPSQNMPNYPETLSELPPLYNPQMLASTSQSSSQSMYPENHTYPYQRYPSMPHRSSTMAQGTPIIPPPSYMQSLHSSSQTTSTIPSSSYTQSSYSSLQPLPSLQRNPYPSPRMQRSSSDQRTLQYLHQMSLPYMLNRNK